MYQVDDLLVRARVVVFLFFRDILQGADCLSQILFQLQWDGRVGLYDTGLVCNYITSFTGNAGLPLEFFDDPIHHARRYVMTTTGDLLSPFCDDIILKHLGREPVS